MDTGKSSIGTLDFFETCEIYAGVSVNFSTIGCPILCPIEIAVASVSTTNGAETKNQDTTLRFTLQNELRIKTIETPTRAFTAATPIYPKETSRPADAATNTRYNRAGGQSRSTKRIYIQSSKKRYAGSNYYDL